MNGEYTNNNLNKYMSQLTFPGGVQAFESRFGSYLLVKGKEKRRFMDKFLLYVHLSKIGVDFTECEETEPNKKSKREISAIERILITDLIESVITEDRLI